MKRYYFQTWMAAFALWLAACNNYVAFVPPAEPPENTTPAQEFLDGRNFPADSAKADVTQADTIALGDGVVLILPKLCLERKNGTLCNCQVDVHLKLLTSKKDILLFGRPTVTADGLLETGGQAKLTILHKGDTLQLKAGVKFTLKIPTKLTPADRGQMRYFTQKPPQESWQPAGPLAEPNSDYYIVESDRLDVWHSPAHAYATGKPDVRIRLSPSGEQPDAGRTRVFVLPSGVHSVVNAVQTGGEFAATAPLPLNREAVLVAIGKKGGLLLLAIQKTILQPTMNVVPEFKPVTPAQLEAALLAL